MNIHFLYWNINNKPANFISEIKKIASDVDILLLLDNNSIDDNLIEQELGLYKINYKKKFIESKYTPKFYSRFRNNELEHVTTTRSKRLVFTSLKLQNSEEILIGGIHFPSKLHKNEFEQFKIATGYVEEIEELEFLKKHKRTLIFGDFNMNPYESGMIDCSAFNATLSEIEAKKKNRMVNFRNYNYFYNPMWSFMGDRNYLTGEKKIAGSYYSRKSSPCWNMFDKVIIRPDIIDIFDFSSLKIIDSLGKDKLVLDDFIINKNKYSDHLPLSFKINL